MLDLSDNGELMNRCQWTDVLQEMKGSTEPGKAGHAKFIVFYVHGWKHNSDPADTDLKNFTALINELRATSTHPKQDIVGIFIGWPGASSSLPGLEHLTFWGRKNAADRAIAVGNLTKLLGTAANIVKIRRNDDDFITAIGHSFGARILFSSVAPVLLHNQSMSHPGVSGGRYKPFYGATNLTILLNPAFEASRFTAFDSNIRIEEQYDAGQEPTLLTISTSNDYPTRYAFPIGQILSGRWTERERTTLGNYSDFTTHTLRKENLSGQRAESPWWFDQFCANTGQPHETGETLCLTRTARIDQPGNPFLVAKTDEAVLNGHNGIWEKSFQNWLIAFMKQTEQAQAEHRRDAAAAAARIPD